MYVSRYDNRLIGKNDFNADQVIVDLHYCRTKNLGIKLVEPDGKKSCHSISADCLMRVRRTELPYQGLARLRRPDNKGTVVPATLWIVPHYQGRHGGLPLRKPLDAGIYFICFYFLRLSPYYSLSLWERVGVRAFKNRRKCVTICVYRIMSASLFLF